MPCVKINGKNKERPGYLKYVEIYSYCSLSAEMNMLKPLLTHQIYKTKYPSADVYTKTTEEVDPNWYVHYKVSPPPQLSL